MSKKDMIKDFIIFTLMLFCITFFMTPFYMMVLILHFEEIYVDSEDCEKVISRYANNPTLEEAIFGNQKIFENGSNENESVAWFDTDLIRKGKIKECYYKSYWKQAFRLLLENDRELKFLKEKIK